MFSLLLGTRLALVAHVDDANRWDDERAQLLGCRISELGLAIRGTRVEQLVGRLHEELGERGIAFRPPVYLSDEWGCPDGTPLIGVPFYLADQRLERIEAEHSGSVETGEEAMRYLRHEAGHAVNYAFRLHERADFASTFGDYALPYREHYRADPLSRAHVRHILGWYAQKHPDEDFAETFAVWLDPSSKWRWNYRSWDAALAKLQYVDKIFRKERRAERRPLGIRYNESGGYKTITSTVAEYFAIERKIDPRLKEYLQDLREIFPKVGPRARRLIRADLFIQNYAEYLEDELTNWIAGADRREVKKYLRELQTLCALNGSRLRPDQATEKLVALVFVATYHLMKRLRHVK